MQKKPGPLKPTTKRNQCFQNQIVICDDYHENERFYCKIIKNWTLKWKKVEIDNSVIVCGKSDKIVDNVKKKDLFGCFRIEESEVMTTNQVWKREEE